MAQEVIWDLDFTNYVLCNGAAALWIMSNIIKIYCTLKRWNVWHKTVINAADLLVGLDDIKKSNQHRAEKWKLR